MTLISYALGGIIACAIAGFIQLLENRIVVDPNFYFGTYAFLIVVLLIASITLNRNLEPEIILR